MLLLRTKNTQLPTMGSFLNDFFDCSSLNGLFNETHRSNDINLNILEKNNSYELSLALPGFSKEEINIEVKDEVLIISSGIEKVEEKEDEIFIKKSFSKTSFQKSFQILDDVNLDNINANMENGLLNISLGKKNIIEEQTKNKKIDII